MDKIIFGIGSITSICLCNYLYTNKETVGYKLIYLYSSAQIFLQRFGFTAKRKMIEDKSNEYCYFNVFDDVNVNELCELKQELLSDDTADNIINKISKCKMLVYKDGLNQVCIHKPITNFVLTYEKSNVSFIALTVKMDLIEINIKLSTPEFNFYIVNNIINRTFIRYYIRHILNQPFLETQDYLLVLVDDNVQFTTLTTHDEILIEKDTYSVIFKNNVGGAYIENNMADKKIPNKNLTISIDKCNNREL